MSQNKLGHILGHVKDLGGDYSDANTRGYMTNAEMRFHTDACDYVGPALPADADVGRRQPHRKLGDGLQHHAQSGAPSWSRRCAGDYYRSRSGEISQGDLPYFKQPIFSLPVRATSARPGPAR